MIAGVLVTLLVVAIVAVGAYVAGKRAQSQAAKDNELSITLKRELEAEADKLKAEAAKKKKQLEANIPNMSDAELAKEINK